MLTVQHITHIQCDEKNVAWIAETNTKVIEVAMEEAAYGWDASEIHAAHPHLTLGQIHAALAFYHDHFADFVSQMHRLVEDHRLRSSEATTQITRQELLNRLTPTWH